MRDDFCVFILSHGRSDRVVTYTTVKNSGYTGKIFVVCDNEDDQLDEYKKRFENVFVFDKKEKAQQIDTADLSDDRRCIVYARNACFEIAEQLGYKYFLELDDDYTEFSVRYVENGRVKTKPITDLDKLFENMIDFLEKSGAITVAIGQGGDYVGGTNNKNLEKHILRKAMNTFFCSTERKFGFVGRINEDVNTYTYYGNKGHLIMTFLDCMIVQKRTQSNEGGMTEMYLDNGTYLKSIYSVLFSPQCVKVGYLCTKHKRLHHFVDWNACAPKILNERYRRWKDAEGWQTENRD